MSQHALNADDESFERLALRSDLPVIVDFWAPWCGPCKALAPVMDALAEERAGSLRVVKVNIDDSHQTPAQYGVRGIPTLLLIKDGELLGQLVGAQSKAKIDSFIESHLKG